MGNFMTWFDFLLIAVLVISIGFAAIRGAMREFATLIALGGAAALAFLVFNPLLGVMGLEGSIFGMAGLAAGLLGLFFGLLYVGFHFALKRVALSPELARVDRIGGGAFGLLHGLALIGLGFLGYAYYADEEHRAEGVNDAVLLPVAQSAADFFEALAPEHDSQEIISPEEIDQRNDAAADGYRRGERAALEEIVATATTSENPGAPATRDGDAGEAADPIATLLDEDAARER